MALVFSSWCLDISLILLGYALYLLYSFRKAYSYWEKKGVVFIKPTMPFGNMKNVLLFRKSTAEEHQTLYNELNGHRYGGYFMITNPRLLIRDPELMKQILVKDFAHFHDRGIKVDEKQQPLTAHLLALSGKRWKNLRTKLTPAFTSGKIKMMFPIFVECVSEMNTKLKEMAKNKESLDMKEILAQFTTDVIGSCAFGLQLNSIKDRDSEFRSFGRKVFHRSLLYRIVTLMSSSFPVIALRLKPLIDDLSSFFLKAVKDMVKHREENNIKRNDFLQILIQLKNKEKLDNDFVEKVDYPLQNDTETNLSKENDIELTDALMAAQCFIFFAAGFETSSTTASYCLYELALNPDIQDKLRDEVESVLTEHEGKITYESIQKMKYLDQVLDETLRKFPPGADLIRECTIPYKISGTDIIIDKGMQVFIPVLALHRDPKYYPDPERFDPERFSEENKTTRIPFTYLPFGEGPRICIGIRFGLLQIKVGIAALISNYKFSVCEKTTIPMKFKPGESLSSPKDGVWLNIEQR